MALSRQPQQVPPERSAEPMGSVASSLLPMMMLGPLAAMSPFSATMAGMGNAAAQAALAGTGAAPAQAPPKTPREQLMEELATLPPELWEQFDSSKIKGVDRMEILDLGTTVLTHQLSKVSTDYDGDALPTKWDACYQPDTSLHVENKDKDRKQVDYKSDKELKKLGTSRAEVLQAAKDCDGSGNKREYYDTTTAPVGAKVGLNYNERYAVMNGRLNEELAKRLGTSTVMGGSALVRDHEKGDMSTAVTADVGPRGSAGEVSRATRDQLPQINSIREDKSDAIDLYYMHRRNKEQPFKTTDDVANMDKTVDDQILTEVLPALRSRKQMAELQKAGKADEYDAIAATLGLPKMKRPDPKKPEAPKK